MSCSYNITLANDEGSLENNVHYDIEFLDGVFTHLAIVNNPRYERANIVLNSKAVDNYNEEQKRDEKGQWVKENDINPDYDKELQEIIEKAKTKPNEHYKIIIGKVSKNLEKKAKEKNIDIQNYNHNLDVSGTRHTFKQHGNREKEKLRGQIKIDDNDFKKIPEIIYSPNEIIFGEKDNKNTPLIKYVKKFDDGTIYYIEEIRTRQKTLTIKTMWKQKNNADNSCFFTDFNPQRIEYISNIIINDIEEKCNPNIVEKEEEREMALLDELKKLVASVENAKEDFYTTYQKDKCIKK